ncbi:MAG: Gfo/Idh/MocA family oxidoreductase [Acidimicrobiaceae bacterium]|nr:Gfo/Idh/MocA family oxidoreductase [Acidimicrobiaceae bacterium]
MSVGWGIVGIGFIADSGMAPAIATLDESHLEGVVSRDAERARAFADKHHASHAYTDFAEMLANPQVDAVLITTPNALHAEQVVQAAKAGKHVLSDKPLALSVAEAERAVDECRRAGVKLGINFQTRHHTCFQESRNVIAAGGIGDPLVVQLEVGAGAGGLKGWRTDPGLAGLGSINNVGVHGYDLLRFLLGAEVTEVVALLDVGRKPELETLAISLLRFDNGTLAYVNTNQKVPNHQPDIQIYGTKGRIVGHNITRPWLEDGELRVLTAEGESVTRHSSLDAFRRCVHAFNQAVLENTEPNASGTDGLRSVQLTEAMARSAREGKVVELRNQ